MKKQGLNAESVCNELIDTVLENLTGKDVRMWYIRSRYDDYQIDKTSTDVAKICKCTCSQRLSLRGNLIGGQPLSLL